MKMNTQPRFYLRKGCFQRSAPGGARTHNLRLRRPSLYPIELRAQKEKPYVLQAVAAILEQ